jgi:hypothetical protein
MAIFLLDTTVIVDAINDKRGRDQLATRFPWYYRSYASTPSSTYGWPHRSRR